VRHPLPIGQSGRPRQAVASCSRYGPGTGHAMVSLLTKPNREIAGPHSLRCEGSVEGYRKQNAKDRAAAGSIFCGNLGGFCGKHIMLTGAPTGKYYQTSLCKTPTPSLPRALKPTEASVIVFPRSWIAVLIQPANYKCSAIAGFRREQKNGATKSLQELHRR
jgi:hypothetical protein